MKKLHINIKTSKKQTQHHPSLDPHYSELINLIFDFFSVENTNEKNIFIRSVHICSLK